MKRRAMLLLSVAIGVVIAAIAASAGDDPVESSGPLDCSVVASAAITPDLAAGQSSPADALLLAARWPHFVDVQSDAFQEAQVLPDARTDSDAADSFAHINYLLTIDGRAAAIVTVEQLDEDASGSWYLTGYSVCSPVFPKEESA